MTGSPAVNLDRKTVESITTQMAGNNTDRTAAEAVIAKAGFFSTVHQQCDFVSPLANGKGDPVCYRCTQRERRFFMKPGTVHGMQACHAVPAYGEEKVGLGVFLKSIEKPGLRAGFGLQQRHIHGNLPTPFLGGAGVDVVVAYRAWLGRIGHRDAAVRIFYTPATVIRFLDNRAQGSHAGSGGFVRARQNKGCAGGQKAKIQTFHSDYPENEAGTMKTYCRKDASSIVVPLKKYKPLFF